MLSCQRSTELMSMQVEKRLSATQNIGLAIHLTACKGCRNFQKQMKTIHQACKLLPEQLFKDPL